MNLFTLVYKSLIGIVHGLLGIFNKAMCFLHIKRGRKNSGSLLPMTVDRSSSAIHSLQAGEVQSSLPSNETVELESWDSWGAESGVAAASASKETAHNIGPINHFGNNMMNVPTSDEPEEIPEPDYFQDMLPEFRRTKKIVVKKKEENYTLSSRLAMSSEVPVIGGELESWEDGGENAWAVESLEDLSWEAESALREKRKQEREQRQRENQRKKLERDSTAKPMRKESHFSAVKLS